MKMNDTVARIVEIMFQDVEMNEETAAIRDEVMNNCQERYNDLVISGVSEDDAIAAVIESLKGMEDVLAPYKRRRHRHADTYDLDDEMEDLESGDRDVQFPAGEIHRVELCLVSEDVRIEPSADNFFHVLWDAAENPLVQAYAQNGVLKIERGAEGGKTARKERFDTHIKTDFENMVRSEHGKIEIDMSGLDRAMKSLGDSMKRMFSRAANGDINIRLGFCDSEVTVQVPHSAMPHMKLLTTSGDINVWHVALADLNVTSTSGDITIALHEDESLKLAELRTTSGDIEATTFTHEMIIASTSGDVEVEGYYHDLTVNTISGDIDVRADVKNMTFKAVSGDVDLAFDSVEIREVRGSTISGDIDIDLPDGIGFMDIQTQTRSGDVTTRHHCDGVGPTVTGSVTSMSGDITIR